MCKKYLEGI
jgi:5'-3' exoribonuclease 1